MVDLIHDSIPMALTFDDVLLVPQYSNVLPSDTDIQTQLTPSIHLAVPLISAAMDTVTGSAMAIAMAQLGGIGIVHKNLTPKAQADEVARVKKSQSGLIRNPVTIDPAATVTDVRALTHQHGISGIPVVDGSKLVGIITRRDMRFEEDAKRMVRDVMTQQVVTAKEGTTLDQAKVLLHENRIEKLPVVDDAGRLVGLFTIKDLEKSEDFPQATKDERRRLCCGAALGVGVNQREMRLEALVAAGVDVVTIDTAHGHTELVIEAVRKTKQDYPHLPLIAGNVATPEAVDALLDAGADSVKVGIGPGSICTTRIVAGVGVPQLTAVLSCAKAAKKRGASVIADGGIRHSGDVVKALAAGAGAAMIGGLFAGTDEAPGEVILYQGRSYKGYRGMGSLGAMNAGSADRYFQQQSGPSKFVPEGVEGLVPYKGPVGRSVYQLTGGVRSGMGYCGASDLSALHSGATFVRISGAGMRESHVHDVTVTKESPNYRT